MPTCTWVRLGGWAGGAQFVQRRRQQFLPAHCPTHPPVRPPAQMFVEDMDLTVALHRTFLRDDGQPREDLSEQEKLQVSAHCWSGLLCWGAAVPGVVGVSGDRVRAAELGFEHRKGS